MPTATDIVIELARRAGCFSEADLTAAREQQAQHVSEPGEPLPLTEVLVAQGKLSESRICELLAEAFALPVERLDGRSVPGSVLALLEVEHARRYHAMPLEWQGDRLRVAMADAHDFAAVDELALVCGHPVEAVLATRSEIRAAIGRHYGDAAADDLAIEPATPSTGAIAASDGDGAEDAPVIQRLHSLIADAVRRRASDIHLEPLERRFRVRYRIDGRLLEVEGPPKRMQLPLISRAKIMAEMSIAEKRLPQDGRIQRTLDGRSIDLRVSSVPTAHGESIVMRLLDADGLKPDLGELGLLPEDEQKVRRLVGQSDGMVLVTGPTGSGKTTTLYSCLHAINRPDRKIITVEDPVEYQLAGVNQVPVRADVGLTFAAALRAMLRQSPNVVMVGEIRDRETAEIAINASLTGHLVFSTLHTNDAPGAVSRLVDLGVKPFLIANSLRAVVAQRLVRRVCEACAQPEAISEAARAVFAAHGVDHASATCRKGRGCADCNGTGYRGRIAIFEFFMVDEDLARLIHDREDLPKLRVAARRAGLRTLREDGLSKVVRGLTTLEEVLSATLADDSY